MAPVRLFGLVAVASAVELTPENYDTVTEGKTIFIMFRDAAYRCNNCEKIQPDWDRLTEDYVGNKDAGVYQIDCSLGEESKKFCLHHGVQRNFPVLKWGDPHALSTYRGKKSLEGFKKFAGEHLVPICSAGRLELCDDEKKALLKKFLGQPMTLLADNVAKLEAKIESLTAKIIADGAAHDEKAKTLTKGTPEHRSHVDNRVAKLKEILEEKKAAVHELNHMRAVHIHRKKLLKAASEL